MLYPLAEEGWDVARELGLSRPRSSCSCCCTRSPPRKCLPHLRLKGFSKISSTGRESQDAFTKPCDSCQLHRYASSLFIHILFGRCFDICQEDGTRNFSTFVRNLCESFVPPWWERHVEKWVPATSLPFLFENPFCLFSPIFLRHILALLAQVDLTIKTLVHPEGQLFQTLGTWNNIGWAQKASNTFKCTCRLPGFYPATVNHLREFETELAINWKQKFE